MKCTAVQERKLTQILLHTSCQWKVADNLSLLRKRKKEVKKRNKTEKKPKIGKVPTQTPSNHFQYRMHCNYQISNRDLLTAGYHPKLMKKCNFWPWAPKKIVVSFEQFELLAAAIHFLAGQQEPRQFIVYLVCNESLVSSHHFAHMHLFKKVVDTSSFRSLQVKITGATMTPGAEQNCLEQLIMQLILIAVFQLRTVAVVKHLWNV